MYVFVGYTTTDQKDVKRVENDAITRPASNSLWYDLCWCILFMPYNTDIDTDQSSDTHSSTSSGHESSDTDGEM